MDNFSVLPEELVLDILTRLPTESILDSKSVFKTWRNLIQYPSFYQAHVNRLNHYVDSGKLCFLALTSNQQLHYFEYNEKNHETPIDKLTRINLTLPIFPLKDKVDTFVGSSNGLICLRYWNGSFCVCNPMTKEYVILPESKTDFGKYEYWSCGYGYIPLTNEYKVIVLYELKYTDSIQVEVYTLGSGHGWRNLGKFNSDSGFCTKYSGQGFFLNGVIYWWHPKFGVLLEFDLAVENLREQITSPAKLPIDYFFGHIIGDFGENWFNAHVNSWIGEVLSDREEQHQSFEWSKEFIPPTNDLFAFTGSGGILSFDSNYINIHDPKTLTSKRLAVFKNTSTDYNTKYGFYQVFPHKNTLLSLKELGEEDTKILKSGCK